MCYTQENVIAICDFGTLKNPLMGETQEVTKSYTYKA